YDAALACVEMCALFVVESRRRHTMSYGDWSSDVCSSDLPVRQADVCQGAVDIAADGGARGQRGARHAVEAAKGRRRRGDGLDRRSEERRVGKECRSRWTP